MFLYELQLTKRLSQVRMVTTRDPFKCIANIIWKEEREGERRRREEEEEEEEEEGGGGGDY